MLAVTKRGCTKVQVRTATSVAYTAKEGYFDCRVWKRSMNYCIPLVRSPSYLHKYWY